MLLVGITGGIATGKSTVSAILAEHGVPIVDADMIAREVVRPEKTAYQKLRQHFGDEYFDSDTGQLIRKKLGDLVFSNAEARRTVNLIVHPEIRKAIALSVLKYFLMGHRYLVLDLPLLFESGYDRLLQKIVLVDCTDDEQLRRLQKRDSLDEQSARTRIAAQYPLELKRRQAHMIIDNSGSQAHTSAQVLMLIKQMEQSKFYIVVRVGFSSLLIFIIFIGYKIVAILT